MNKQQNALLIAAPNSGSGKTVITLALLRALRNAGIDVRAAKAGPDFIDSVFHEIASGARAVNLDPWAMTDARCQQLARAQGGSHLLVETMMGLFDGAADGSGSAAALAKTLKAPVILVVDASRQSHSIGALVRGFRDHDNEVHIAGVIINKLGSKRHEMMVRQALDKIAMPVVGAVYRHEDLNLPERHLGLVQARENPQIDEFIVRAAERIFGHCNLAKLCDLFSPLEKPAKKAPRVSPPGQHIAVARDEAFSFIYPHLLDDWQSQGAQLSFFSPLADEGPPGQADAIYLPGGYPELHAGKISNAEQFAQKMMVAKNRGAMIYGECGGYMVLGKGLETCEGERHAMLGMLDLDTSFAKRQLHLGYRVAQAHSKFFAGNIIKAHEFHYSTALRENGMALFQAKDALCNELGDFGLRDGNVMGSYLHLIDGSG